MPPCGLSILRAEFLVDQKILGEVYLQDMVPPGYMTTLTWILLHLIKVTLL